MKLLLITLMAVLLTGCMGARYHYAEYDPSTGNLVREFDTNSRRDLEQLKAEYGDFNISVGKTTTPTSPLEQAIADQLPTILQLIPVVPVAEQPEE